MSTVYVFVCLISLTFYSQISLEEIKSLQHAEDTTIILENENSYFHLNQEIKKIEKVSGSKKNDNKLQSLIIGDNKSLDQIPKEYVKENINIYGVYFGKTILKKI